MTDDEAILEIAGLLMDAEALSEAMLAGDLAEERFRARLIAGQARLLGMGPVDAYATEVGRLLGQDSNGPLPGYAHAVNDLSLALDRALSSMSGLRCP